MTLTGSALRKFVAALATIIIVFGLQAGMAVAESTAFRQAVAEAAAPDADVAGFYRARDYRPLWTGTDDAARRAAFMAALRGAGDHGLPVVRYDPLTLTDAFRAVQSDRERGALEVRMTTAFLQYARDIQTGILDPGSVIDGIKRDIPRRDRLATLAAFATSVPSAFLKSLPPKSPAYAQLMKEKLRLERLVADGGWGPKVGSDALTPGQTGAPVVALRNRLMAMGYLGRSATQTFDAPMQKAVQIFQFDHGITADGVATETTMDEINREPVERLQSVIVAMERLRWMPDDLGSRHIWVNQADFTAKIIDDGKVTFGTRAVVGKDGEDTRSPEFSDVMEFMVVNPSWSVPRSITTKEYLPLLKRNPNAAGHLTIVDRNGRAVPRSAINFGAYTAANFPFAMRQPPSDGNALGLVKFMFPNKWNIYLHDTPQKALFAKEVRAFSHGCIRLNDPFDFAYALLARQSDDPQGTFKAALRTGAETVLSLVDPVPVHLVYFTAWPTAKGHMTYRRDVYGRDAVLFGALSQAGVELRAVQG